MRLFRSIRVAIALAACSLAVTACNPAEPPGSASSPTTVAEVKALPNILAPLAGTQVDEFVMRTAWKTADAGLSAIDALRAVGFIRDGSPKAISLADGLETVRRWLNAADDARKAGNQASAAEAFAKASTAYQSFRTAIRS